MDDFIHRSMTKTDDIYGIKVTRMRTSKGYCSIKIEFEGKSIVFSNDNNFDYEGAAREMSDMLDEAANNACLIPVVK